MKIIAEGATAPNDMFLFFEKVSAVPEVCWETRKCITSTREGRSVAVIEEGLGGQHTSVCTPHVRVSISEVRITAGIKCTQPK